MDISKLRSRITASLLLQHLQRLRQNQLAVHPLGSQEAHLPGGSVQLVQPLEGAALADKLKDNNGQYLWQPGLTANAPDTILGRPVKTSAFMPSIAAGAKSIIFGDFNYYWIAEVQQLIGGDAGGGGGGHTDLGTAFVRQHTQRLAGSAHRRGH